MAVTARVKGKDRKEVRKRVKKSDFKYRDVVYRIRPNCIYSYFVFYFFRRDGIDFVEGNPEPVDYYSSSFSVGSHKNVDTISRIVGKIFEYADKLRIYTLILLVCVLAVSVITLLVSSDVL